MKEVIFLIDPNTGKYFTNDYDKYWSKNIEDAYPYSIDDNLTEIINNMISNDIFHRMYTYIVPQRTFIIDN